MNHWLAPWHKLVKRLSEGWGELRRHLAAKTRTETLRPRRARPANASPRSIEERYRPIEAEALVDEVFQRIKHAVYAKTGASIFRESGRLSQNRPYFYLKPAGQLGYLFERSGSGWVVAPAEKIASQDLFIRRGPALDAVSLYMATDRPVLPRVKSPWLGGDLWPLSVYEQKLLERLDLDGPAK